jgi:hypothetical protein
MELITAIALVSSPRSTSSNTDPRDSFYWWILGFNTISLGWSFLCNEDYVLKFLPIQFLLNFPALNIHNKFIISEMPIEVP